MPLSADYNGDGKITVADAAAIAKYLAKQSIKK
ncbi:MAG: dockerin type I domain-containing protein [Oscillospiraceae bacterium]